MYYTNWPREFSHFITDKIGAETYETLKSKAESVTKVDWSQVLEDLKEHYKMLIDIAA